MRKIRRKRREKRKKTCNEGSSFSYDAGRWSYDGMSIHIIKRTGGNRTRNDASASKSESWNLWKENWDKYSKNYENVSLTPGADETQLNFAYYSKTAETPKVKIATNKDMTDAKEVEGAQTEAVQIDGEQYYSTNNGRKIKREYNLLLSGISGWQISGRTKVCNEVFPKVFLLICRRSTDRSFFRTDKYRWRSYEK